MYDERSKRGAMEEEERRRSGGRTKGRGYGDRRQRGAREEEVSRSCRLHMPYICGVQKRKTVYVYYILLI